MKSFWYLITRWFSFKYLISINNTQTFCFLLFFRVKFNSMFSLFECLIWKCDSSSVSCRSYSTCLINWITNQWKLWFMMTNYSSNNSSYMNTYFHFYLWSFTIFSTLYLLHHIKSHINQSHSFFSFSNMRRYILFTCFDTCCCHICISYSFNFLNSMLNT